jgi:hypothetical protein
MIDTQKSEVGLMIMVLKKIFYSACLRVLQRMSGESKQGKYNLLTITSSSRFSIFFLYFMNFIT